MKIEGLHQQIKCMEIVLKNIATALITYSAHYGAAKFYNYACVPNGLFGYISGLITTGSPVCQASVQVISSTQVSYSTMIFMSISRIFLDLIIPAQLKTE